MSQSTFSGVAVTTAHGLQEYCMQLSVSLTLLMSQSSLWLSHLLLVDSSLVADLTDRLTNVVKELASHVVFLLQVSLAENLEALLRSCALEPVDNGDI